jgi:uncharacterized protein with HEPN domain
MKRTPENDRVRLLHMRDNAQEAINLLASRSPDSNERILELALERLIMNVGEAAANITDETRKAFAEVEWDDIIGMRIVLVHRYFRIDDSTVKNVVSEHFPQLVSRLNLYLGDVE